MAFLNSPYLHYRGSLCLVIEVEALQSEAPLTTSDRLINGNADQ
jgi:hypothetical protein